jgi:hypothetical protein
MTALLQLLWQVLNFHFFGEQHHYLRYFKQNSVVFMKLLLEFMLKKTFDVLLASTVFQYFEL